MEYIDTYIYILDHLMIDDNLSSRTIRNSYFFGFTWWKRCFIQPFFKKSRNNEIIFCSTLKTSLKLGLNTESIIYI